MYLLICICMDFHNYAEQCWNKGTHARRYLKMSENVPLTSHKKGTSSVWEAWDDRKQNFFQAKFKKRKSIWNDNPPERNKALKWLKRSDCCVSPALLGSFHLRIPSGPSCPKLAMTSRWCWTRHILLNEEDRVWKIVRQTIYIYMCV